MDVGYDADRHQYTLDDNRVLSVTQILEAAGLVDYSMIPAQVRDFVLARGTHVHTACDYLDEGDLDMDSLDDDIRPRVEAYSKFKRDTGFVVGHKETVVYSETHRFAGRLDRTGILNGSAVILDFKSGPILPATGLQLAGYQMCLPTMHLRYALQLKPTGDYNLIPFNERGDRTHFLCALDVAMMRHNWRLIKPNKENT